MTALLLHCYPGDKTAALLISVLVQSVTLAAIALIVASRLRHNATVRHGVLLSALTCLGLCPAMTWLCAAAGVSLAIGLPEAIAPSDAMFWRPVDEEYQGAEAPSDGPSHASRTVFEDGSPVHETSAGGQGATSQSSIRQGSSASPAFPWPDTGRAAVAAGFVAWLLVAAMRCVGILRSGWKLHVIRCAGRPISSRLPKRLLDDVARQTGLHAFPTMVASPAVASPVSAGLLRPLIILPEGLLRMLDRAQLRDVLLHEAAHVARRDHLAVLVQKVMGAVYWPNPLLGLLNRRLVRAREELCDNHVVGATDVLVYGETLLRLAEILPARRCCSISATLEPSPWTLEERISGLLSPRRIRTTRLSRSLAAGIISTSLLGVALLAAAAPRHVTLASANPNQSSASPATNEHLDLYGDPIPAGARVRLGTERLRNAGDYVFFQKDGDTLVSANGQTGEIIFWDRRTGRKLRNIPTGEERLRRLAISPDLLRLATLCETFQREMGLITNKIILWNVASGERQQTISWRRDAFREIHDLAFAPPDGSVIATASSNGALCFWDIASGQEILKHRLGEQDEILSFVFSRDGKTLALHGRRHDYLWAWQSGEEPRRLPWEPHRDGCRLAISPDGKLLAARDQTSRRLLVYDLASNKAERTVAPPPQCAMVSDLAFTSDSRTLLVASWNAPKVFRIDASKGTVLRIYDAGPLRPSRLDISPDGRWLAAWEPDAGVKLWELDTGQPIADDAVGHWKSNMLLAITPDGARTVTAGLDGTVRVWDNQTARQLFQFAHDNF